MADMAVSVMPIADVDAWREFMTEISTGARADAHRAFLRRGGVRTETVYRQQTPAGDVMVLVWDGVNPEQMAAHFAGMLQNPQSEHETYLRDHVIPKIHGIDTSQPPPPPAEQLAVITA